MSFISKSVLKIAGLILLFMLIIASATVYYIYEYKEITDIIPYTEPEPIIIREYGLPIDSFNIIRGKVKAGQNISTILNKLNVPPKVIDKIINCSDTVFNLRKIKAGKKYAAFCTMDSLIKVQYFVYEHSPAEFIMFNLNDTVNVTREQKEVTTIEKSASATIESSLWKTMEENDINIEVAVKLSEIYAWTIDFFDLKKSDSFKVIYEEQFADSAPMGVSKIAAACFNHRGKNYYAIPFLQNDVVVFFDDNGNSLRKAFLKAPMKFSRITSKFTSSRFHPVLKIYTSHFGIDYAAPVGSPVHTIGNGKIIMAVYDSGAGNIIKIKHNNGYITSYMHLSGFRKGIKIGANVSQGDVIGYVGSTGLSTGPHLDFSVFKNGVPVNPLKMESPAADPVKKSDSVAFELLKRKLKKQLDRIKI
ncbi:MAG: peptidoglycan DD-metalloendopeptidase family protein [Bacteroidia bacterium]|nr:peptidoglycan DD-metalloendopeptidase family protein [Bacteroidia bacterium]